MSTIIQQKSIKDCSPAVRFRFACIINDMIEAEELTKRNEKIEKARKARESNASIPLFARQVWDTEVNAMELEELAHAVMQLLDAR